MKTRSQSPDAETATLRAYLREISKYPLLTADEEHELGVQVQRDHDEDALKRLVESNLRFVVNYAKRFRGLGVGFLDLIHEGNLGLVVAARRFDPERRVRFITYAVWWVREAILAVLASQSRAFSLPNKLAPVAARYRRGVEELAGGLDRAPTLKEIADEFDISEGEAAALDRVSGYDVSLSDPVATRDSANARELIDMLGGQEPLVEDQLLHKMVADQMRQILAGLDPRERQVMRLRFGLEGGEPRTLQEIGDRMHLSRERVRQIESRAKEKLRRSRKVRGLRSSLN